MHCDWHNHNFINLESMTITYSYDFCNSFVKNFIDLWKKKYVVVYKNLLLLDEWIYLTTGDRLMENTVDRAILRKYILLIEKCDKTKKIRDC